MEMSKKENNEQIPKFAQVSTDVAFQESKKKKKKILKSSENKSEYNYGYFEAKKLMLTPAEIPKFTGA